MKETKVWVTHIDSQGEEKKEKGLILYWGHTFEYAQTTTTRLVDGYPHKVVDQIPLTIIVAVVRILSTGEVVQIKPTAILFDPVSG